LGSGDWYINFDVSGSKILCAEGAMVDWLSPKDATELAHGPCLTFLNRQFDWFPGE